MTFRRSAVASALSVSLCARALFAANAPASAAPAASPVPAANSADVDLREVCVDAHARAQEARQAGDLQASRELLRTCAQVGCPQVVRADCGPWYDEVDRSIPSLVFAASSPRGDETAVRVTLDGKPLLDGVSAAAQDVNPGQHAFRFELAGYPAVEQTLLVREGEKSRVVYVKFNAPEPPPVAPVPQAPPPPVLPVSRPAPVSRPVPLVSYVLAGGALAGVAWGSYFGEQALSARSSADRTCRPICDESTVHGVRDKAILADVGFGVALLSASAAVYFYVTRPSVSAGGAVGVGLVSDPRGQRLSVSGAF